MAKRYSDTNKWKKPFLRGLEAPYKLLWFYILDDCDHAGIWHVDQEVAEVRIGEKIDWARATEIFKDKIVVFDGGDKWYVPDFVEFQYGVLNPANRVHESVLNLLNKYNLLEKIKGLISPLQGAKDKDKDKDKEKDKDMEGVQGETKAKKPINPEPEIVEELPELPVDFAINEEEYTAAVAFLKSQQFYSIIRMHNSLDDAACLKLFRIFFELKFTTGELAGKKPMDVIKFFHNWIPKYRKQQAENALPGQKQTKFEQLQDSFNEVQNPYRNGN